MAFIVGVDGCRGGWLCISQDLNDRRINSRVYPSVRELISQEPQALIIAVDIPIGLTDSGPRECDKLARRLLGEPRRRSVFPAPIRLALNARNRKEADSITRSVDGRGVSAQAYAFYPKILDVDQVLREDPELQRMVREVHSELCFMAWNAGNVLSPAKKTPHGKAARTTLVKLHFGGDAFRIVREKHLPGIVADDDINDAFAALWTAERIHNWRAAVIPYPPETDSVGLRMEMWF